MSECNGNGQGTGTVAGVNRSGDPAVSPVLGGDGGNVMTVAECVERQVQGSPPGRGPGADPPRFPRQPGETPRAFAAFLAYFQLGQERSLPAVAEALGENAATVKNWSSKYRWNDRLLAFYSHRLETHADSELVRQQQQAADWARRTREFREQEWVAGQKLLEAVSCFLESFGDREVEKMSLGQVSRALQISSRISRQALRGDLAADEPAASPLQAELVASLKKAYGIPATPASAPEPPPPHP